MESVGIISILLLYASITVGQKVAYLNGLNENASCELSDGTYGTCQKISGCKVEYENYRKNRSVLKVCSYTGNSQDHLICCPVTEETPSSGQILSQPGEFKIPVFELAPKFLKLSDHETCLEESLIYRNHSINPNHFGKAMKIKKIPVNKENCDYLEKLNKEVVKNHWDLLYYTCVPRGDGTYEISVVAALYAKLVEEGDRPNMAAIGWTQEDKTVAYKCGGSIITEKFIVTAAHCKFYNGAQADKVRLGDRFLITKQDDEHAQLLKIQDFILHPDYKSTLHYNDIAMIKTAEKIVFNKFVNPSCIANLDAKRVGHFTDWTVAGYGETEDGVASNILLELKVDLVSYEECNKTYVHDRKLPRGILNSQFCVKSQKIGGKIPDTCFGDSGSPLQFKSAHEVFHDDFNTSYLSTVYQTSTVLGIVSFGISCGFEVPSVYTKLEYYRDWIKHVTDTY